MTDSSTWLLCSVILSQPNQSCLALARHVQRTHITFIKQYIIRLFDYFFFNALPANLNTK